MRKLIALLVLFVMSACALQPVTRQDDSVELTVGSTDIPSFASLCQRKGYIWASDNKCRYSETGEHYSLDFVYPIELLPNPLIESTVDTYFVEIREQYFGNIEAHYDPVTMNWYLSVSAFVNRHQPNLVSLQFSEDSYTGGAHPNTNFRSFTFDTANNSILSFADLFVPGIDPLDVITPLVREQLASNMAEMGIDSGVMQSFIEEGTNELSDFSNFALSDSELLISFPPYQVAPYVAGPQGVAIPLSDLAGILRDF